MRVLAISGSLRSGSSNTLMLRAAAALAPEGLQVQLYEGLGELPHFNPDLDAEGQAPPGAVAQFRRLISEADGILISTPEYAHGVPGSLKNALDWLVSYPDFAGKPVLILNASAAGGQWAQASLKETLTIMSTRVLDASLLAPFIRKKLDRADGLDPEASRALAGALSALAAAIAQ